MTSPAEVVREHFDAFSAGELSRMLATLAPHAVFVTGTTRVDPSEFADFFGSAIRVLAPTVHIGTLVADGAAVACEFVEELTIDGARHRLDRAAFYRIDDGVITAARVYDVRDD